MTLEPLLAASPAIQIHVAAAVAAFGLGSIVLSRRKGDRLHRIGGRIWVALMLLVCLSSFFIHTIRLWGPWSPIHLLSVTTLFSLGSGVWLAMRRQIEAHRRTMQSTFAGALVIAGLFTFLPGRIMHEVLFGGGSPVPGILLAVFAVAVALLVLQRRTAAGPARTGETGVDIAD
ncbi:DUF2306 domain-containing protein [Mesorhizobium xinjiangense]|uniref:DUF2306 domain-containing protein n=1 Tax=Mesorhizobium xinjiangense TaxID=2678685 RepID=UPI0012EDEE96|nr:DUF2306 domain-containing protein [Mesorhizobium xinjiangense]